MNPSPPHPLPHPLPSPPLFPQQIHAIPFYAKLGYEAVRRDMTRMAVSTPLSSLLSLLSLS